MNRKTKELKRMARETLNQRYSVPMGAFFLSNLIISLVGLPFSFYLQSNPSIFQYIITLVAEFFISLVGFVFTAGQYKLHLNMFRQKPFAVSQIFTIFRDRPERYIEAGFLYFLLMLASSLPFIGGAVFFFTRPADVLTLVVLVATCLLSLVLAVYMSVTYGLVFFFLIDYPNQKITDAFRENRLYIKGKKGRFLYLLLSFLGLDILIVLSLGVASLWVVPYQTQTKSLFYLDLTGELDRGHTGFNAAV